jgi:hypothetical protein
MPGLRRWLTLALVIAISLAVLASCGSPPTSEESQWRSDADASLKALKGSTSYHYQINLENWVSVSGQSIYGDEKGEGSFAGGNYQVPLSQQSPSGDASLNVFSYQGKTYIDEGDGWREVKQDELPAPLCDPTRFLETVSGYDSIQLEGEDRRAGMDCQRYLVKVAPDRARSTFSSLGWSYFSQLRFEVTCRLWISQPSLPPLSMQLEVAGYDAEENLQRYRLLATLDLSDIGSPQVEVTPPQDLNP